jgi:hypothetical protein
MLNLTLTNLILSSSPKDNGNLSSPQNLNSASLINFLPTSSDVNVTNYIRPDVTSDLVTIADLSEISADSGKSKFLKHKKPLAHNSVI